MVQGMIRVLLFLCATASIAAAQQLPAGYFPLMEAGAAAVEQRLGAEPAPSLATLEAQPGWEHFPFAILAPAVLYTKRHPANPHYHDTRMLNLALRIGDLLVSQDEKGLYAPRLDSDWDTYMWLDAYRLLQGDLGEERRRQWQQHILRNAELVYDRALWRLDYPWYNAPYIGTSPNHYAQYASLLLLAGRVLGKQDWERLGTQILHRFCSVEQAPDGYWGEHSRGDPPPATTTSP